jgi:uncharacterized RDD family membrane protein YckC
MRPDEARRTVRSEAAGNGQPAEPNARSARAARAQAVAARAHGVHGRTQPEPTYGGLVTRAIAFAIDAAIVNVCGLTVGVVAGLALSILNTPDETDKILVVIGGVLFVCWTITYFVAFWSTTGQTPGNRVMRIRVRHAERDESLRVRWALVRVVSLVLAAAPLLLGFLPILLTDRRQGLQDFLGRSVVVSAVERD